MALGAGSVTPMQMATAYSVFANGGYRVNPYLDDPRDRPQGQGAGRQAAAAAQRDPARGAAAQRLPDGQPAAVGGQRRHGRKAQATLKRTDIYGKTGTTNDSLDAWFAGFQPTMAAVAWMGYDTPRKLGDRETGGGLSLPIWINFMETAIKGVPVAEVPAPPGVVNVGGEWYYDDYAPGRGVASLGVDSGPTPPAEAIAARRSARRRRPRSAAGSWTSSGIERLAPRLPSPSGPPPRPPGGLRRSLSRR